MLILISDRDVITTGQNQFDIDPIDILSNFY